MGAIRPVCDPNNSKLYSEVQCDAVQCSCTNPVTGAPAEPARQFKVAASTLSDRYISERFLPDKAIDLVDEAAARLKIDLTSKPEIIDEIDRKVIQLQMERL